MAANRDPLAGKRLDSWKEIAAFFGRAERTVKRWETERGLPVRRVPGSGRGGVFAYSDELADWLKGSSQDLDEDEVSATPSSFADGSAAATLPPPDDPIVLGRPRLQISRVAAWLTPVLLAGGILAFLSVGPGGLHFRSFAHRQAPNQEAQDLYLKGRYYWARRTPEDLNKAVDYFTQAIVKDPGDAQAYVGLADCYNLLREFGAMPPGEAYPRSLAAAERAVELDDHSAEAHASLAFVTFWWSWQGATAEREFKRALQLNPNLVRAHHWYATYLLALQRYPEALDQIEQAQRLEPSSTAILADKGYLLWCSGKHSAGLALLQLLESTQPSLSSTHDYLGKIFWEQRDYPNALREWRSLAELRHDEAGLAIADAREKGFAAGGLTGMWNAELPMQENFFSRGLVSAYTLAATYAALGRKAEALAHLQIAFDRREAGILTDDPAIPALQDEPAFQQLQAKVRQHLAM